MADRPPRRLNYLKAAFANAYNVTALAGVTLASAFTGDAWPLVLGGGAALEAAWLYFAASNPQFRRKVDRQVAAESREEALRHVHEQVPLLPAEERQKVQTLTLRVTEVKNEVVRNPRLQGDFMDDQIRRLEALVLEYVQVAVTSHKCEVHLTRSDSRQIQREMETWRLAAENATDAAARELALQNRGILEKRLAIAEELARFVARARGQMALIQNSVALLRDQVMTMTTPQALTHQLDELLTSIDVMRETTREIDAVVTGSSSLSLGDAALSPGTDLSAAAPARAGRVRE